MPDVLSELDRRAAEAIRRVESGEASVIRATADADHVLFETSDGWKFRVFDDCGDWDYIDTVIAPDKSRLEWAEIGDPSPVLLHRPSNEALARWGWSHEGVSPGGYHC